MGRPERPLDASGGPVAAFAHDLRLLRNEAGNPSYRELARTALFAPSVLSSAASGYRLPTLPVTRGFVIACGGDPEAWEKRWRQVSAEIGQSEAAGRRPAAPEEPARPAAPAPVALPAAAVPPPPAELPYRGGPFAGRRPELATLTRLVQEEGPARAPIVVCGPVGVGKSAFALRLAEEVAGTFQDGQLYADLAACPYPEYAVADVIHGFLHALGTPAGLIPEGEAAKLGRFRSLLTQRRLFVLLENVRDEHRIDPLLAATAQSQVVITSRSRLLGLEGAVRVELSTFARRESLTLLGQHAGLERVQDDPESAQAVAEACGDLPMAVDLAGRRLAFRPEWTFADAARLFADRAALLDNLCVGTVSIRDRLAGAYRRLAPDARAALQGMRRLGAVRASAGDLAAVLDVSATSADRLLDVLVDAGLISRSGTGGGYRASAVVRAFAAEADRHERPPAGEGGSHLTHRGPLRPARDAHTALIVRPLRSFRSTSRAD